jgi:hypothetical protein
MRWQCAWYGPREATPTASACCGRVAFVITKKLLIPSHCKLEPLWITPKVLWFNYFIMDERVHCTHLWPFITGQLPRLCPELNIVRELDGAYHIGVSMGRIIPGSPDNFRGSDGPG